MAAFFTADQHFGHGGALGFYHRPFGSVREMDAAMIARWNAIVGPKDDIWHLGDFAWRAKPPRGDELLRALHGRKHLITGNNDDDGVRSAAGWASVRDYAEIECEGVPLVLCHYPFRTWRAMAKGAINLHGHSHGRLKPLTRQCDVGVDAWDFRPTTLAEIRARMERR